MSLIMVQAHRMLHLKSCVCICIRFCMDLQFTQWATLKPLSIRVFSVLIWKWNMKDIEERIPLPIYETCWATPPGGSGNISLSSLSFFTVHVRFRKNWRAFDICIHSLWFWYFAQRNIFAFRVLRMTNRQSSHSWSWPSASHQKTNNDFSVFLCVERARYQLFSPKGWNTITSGLS